MNELVELIPFVMTKEHRRFVEFCDACRRYRYLGLCYGAPGVGKTVSARTYAHQDHIEQVLDTYRLLDLPVMSEILEYKTLFYTPAVVNSLARLEKEISHERQRLSQLHYWMRGAVEKKTIHKLSLPVPDVTELIVVDEADRLKAGGLEQLRDIYDRSRIGLVLMGMPGIEKRLARFPQLYSRVGFVHHFKPLSREEVQFVLTNKWQALGLNLDITDFTDVEAVTAVTRITNGNFRLLQRLLGQIERVLKINQLQSITKEVVETARELLIIGSV